MTDMMKTLIDSPYQGKVIAWTLTADAVEYACELKVKDGEGGPEYYQGIASTVDEAIRRAFQRARIAV